MGTKLIYQPPPGFHVRMPDELRDRLKEQAKENGRSLNMEIVHRLRASLTGYSK